MAMANESGSKASTSGSSSADSYIGSFISLISKYEIRYEGVLYCLNTQDSTIGLKNVKSYGTEGRKKDGPQIPPNDKVYEYILFRGSDIKDLQVKSSPSQIEEQAPDDPAIIQSHYAGVPPSPSPSTSVGGVDLSESSHSQDTVVLSGRAYPPGGLASYQQSATQSADLQTAKITGVSSFDMPLYWQGYNGTSISISHTPELPIPFQPSSSMPSFPLAVQNPDVQACKTTGFTNTSESITLVRPKFYPTLAPEQSTTTPYEMPHSLSSNPYPPSHAASMNANRFINTIETPFFDNVVSGQSLPFSASSVLMPPPTLLTPDQLVQSRLAAPSSTQNLFLDGNAMGVMTNPTAVHAAPLFPLPLSAQQSQKSSTQFNEEFDFTAMNEKFKKDEVWGYLGKATTEEDAEENAIGQSIGDKEGLTKFDAKPAYNKDEFFDTISCNSLGRGAPRNGHNRFSHRMRLDNETFGNFQQRHHGGYGGYGGRHGHGHGHGEHYMGRGSYNWGRGYGYGYGGRGCGGNMPF